MMCLDDFRYHSPFETPREELELNRTENSIIAMYSLIQPAGPLLPCARKQSEIQQALPRFTINTISSQSCLIPVSIRVIGKGSISLPCSVIIIYILSSVDSNANPVST